MTDANRLELFEPELRKQGFLVAEKNGALRRGMVKVLKDAGVTRIVEAETGKDTLVALKTNRDLGVIVCSVAFPDMHGLKLLPQIVQDKKFQSTTLMMVFKLMQQASLRWQRLRGSNYIIKIMQGIKYTDGKEVKKAA